MTIEGSEHSSRHDLGSSDTDLKPMQTPPTAMPSNDNFRTCICKHTTPLDTCWPIVRHFETFGAILSNFVSNFWAILSNFAQFFRASLGHLEQFWGFLLGMFGSCRAVLNNFWKHDMALLTLDSVQNVSIEAALRHLTWLKKVADVNPTDLDPKTRSVIYVRLLLLLWVITTMVS